MLKRLLLVLILMSTGCTGTQVAQVTSTATLAPLVTLTARYTATAVVSRTPLPSLTYTPSVTPIPPSPTTTYTPTEVPPIVGIISSLQTVNIRQGPGASYSAIVALDPGTGVEVLMANTEGTWYNVRLDDGTEGWVFGELLRIESTPTPFPSSTPSPDMTAILLGTSLPTALFGGGTVTATPPRSAITPTSPTTDGTPAAPTAAATTPPATASTPSIPVINLTAIQQTATALAAGISSPVPVTRTLIPLTPGTPETAVAGTPAPTPLPGTVVAQQGVDVLAYCNDPSYNRPAPTNLAVGSTVDIYWGWYAKTREQVQQHLDNVNYEVRFNGRLLQNWRDYGSSVQLEEDGNYHIYWFVPGGAVTQGQNTITYRATWSNQITDGYNNFGPGTNRLSEEGTCTLTVR